ncbi:MAG: hypothetical protein ACYDEY_01310 [Acidimicrobiales bacterium]
MRAMQYLHSRITASDVGLFGERRPSGGPCGSTRDDAQVVWSVLGGLFRRIASTYEFGGWWSVPDAR